MLNQSAVNSLDKGLKETLTLHRLGIFEFLWISLKTTNSLESLNSQFEQYNLRVSYWKNYSQLQRWVARALMEIEPNLKNIKGYKHLPLLLLAMERDDEKQILTDVA